MAVQDEGFGTMDEHELPAAKAAMREVADSRGNGSTYFYISHVPGMSSMADDVISVSDHDGVSELEVN